MATIQKFTSYTCHRLLYLQCCGRHAAVIFIGNRMVYGSVAVEYLHCCDSGSCYMHCVGGVISIRGGTNDLGTATHRHGNLMAC